MRQYGLVVLIVLAAVPLYGQMRNFDEGYVILATGDTVYGSIRQTSRIERSEFVVFIGQEQQQPVTYYPKDLIGFKYGLSHVYETVSVPITDLERNSTSSRSLFLRKLVEGKIELFRLDHRLRENPSPFYELETEFYFFRDKAEGTLINLGEQNYRKKLEDAFEGRNCLVDPGINYRFNDSGLAKLIEIYNQCIQSEYKALLEYKRKNKPRFNLGLGFASAKLAPSHPAYELFPGEREIAFDVFAMMSFKVWKKLDLRGGLNFKHRFLRQTAIYTVQAPNANEGEDILLASDLTINQICTPWHLKYAISSGKLVPYSFAGGYFGVALRNSAYAEGLTRNTTGGEVVFTNERYAPYGASINSIELGWMAGVGLAIKMKPGTSFLIELHYTRGGNDSSKSSFNYISQDAFIFMIGIGL